MLKISSLFQIVLKIFFTLFQSISQDGASFGLSTFPSFLTSSLRKTFTKSSFQLFLTVILKIAFPSVIV